MVRFPSGVAGIPLSQIGWLEVKYIDIFGITSGRKADNYTKTLRYVMLIKTNIDSPRLYNCVW
jgi:hypothetical protein